MSIKVPPAFVTRVPPLPPLLVKVIAGLSPGVLKSIMGSNCAWAGAEIARHATAAVTNAPIILRRCILFPVFHSFLRKVSRRIRFLLPNRERRERTSASAKLRRSCAGGVCAFGDRAAPEAVRFRSAVDVISTEQPYPGDALSSADGLTAKSSARGNREAMPPDPARRLPDRVASALPPGRIFIGRKQVCIVFPKRTFSPRRSTGAELPAICPPCPGDGQALRGLPWNPSRATPSPPASATPDRRPVPPFR